MPVQYVGDILKITAHIYGRWYSTAVATVLQMRD
jgi:hypothetical protein